MVRAQTQESGRQEPLARVAGHSQSAELRAVLYQEGARDPSIEEYRGLYRVYVGIMERFGLRVSCKVYSLNEGYWPLCCSAKFTRAKCRRVNSGSSELVNTHEAEGLRFLSGLR